MSRDAAIPFRNVTLAQADAIQAARRLGANARQLCRNAEVFNLSAWEMREFLARNPPPALPQEAA